MIKDLSSGCPLTVPYLSHTKTRLSDSHLPQGLAKGPDGTLRRAVLGLL